MFYFFFHFSSEHFRLWHSSFARGLACFRLWDDRTFGSGYFSIFASLQCGHHRFGHLHLHQDPIARRKFSRVCDERISNFGNFLNVSIPNFGELGYRLEIRSRVESQKFVTQVESKLDIENRKSCLVEARIPARFKLARISSSDLNITRVEL